MRRALPLLLLLSWFTGLAAPLTAQEEIIYDNDCDGIPVQPAILTRRYGPVETEQEVAGAELEAGYGATNLFQFVHWRRPFYRPWMSGYGWFGPRYFVGYRPRYAGYYPSIGFGPYWGGYYGGFYGGYFGSPYTGFYGAPYFSYYAPPAVFYGGYGGCFYW